MSHIGYYINLDRSADRRAAMEAQLAGLDPPAPYHRFAGVDGNPHRFANPHGLNNAQIGTIASHFFLLQAQRDAPEHLHVIEDDAVLARRIVAFLEQVIASGM